MIYFLVTTSYYNECSKRKAEYTAGIHRLKEVIDRLQFPQYKIIILENNGPRHTFFNDIPFGEVFYTHNNSLSTPNRGYKELKDIHDCIAHYQIPDNDFIVKLTGRYLLHPTSEFMQTLRTIEDSNYQCILRYGSYNHPDNKRVKDCITGLIGMRCRYVKQIPLPCHDHYCVEWCWAETTFDMDVSDIMLLNHLGVDISPAGNPYFAV